MATRNISSVVGTPFAMRPTLRNLLGGLGLATTLTLGGAAAAGPKVHQPMPTSKAYPKINKQVFVNQGLTNAVTLSPRNLSSSGVTMDVTRPLRIEGSTNRVLMTKKTQLMLRFRGAAGRGYRVDCKFTSNPSVHVMEFANGKIVRQSSSNPAGGTVNHTTFSSGQARDMKMFLQANKDTDWSQCKITPT